MRLALIVLFVLVAAVAALLLGKASHAQPQPCPGSDPRTCPAYGDARDMWLQGVTVGAGAGDLMYSQEGAASNPMVQEYACSNHADDDADQARDYPSDHGCSNAHDDDESDSPPEPPAPPPVPPPPPPGGPPPPPPPAHDRMTITLGGQTPGSVTTCVDDLYSGLDLARLPTYAYFTDHATVCDDAMAEISVTLCAMKALAPFNSWGAWAPVVCYAKTTIANFRQYTKVSRRCRQTQTRFNWRGEAIVFVRDVQGRQGSGVHTSPIFPETGQGAYCR